MQRAWKGLLLGTLLASPALANARPSAAFLDCTSATNAGDSTGRYFTSSVFNRLACNEAAKDATERTLATVAKADESIDRAKRMESRTQ
jgi:hypothetical protein